jgi:hypothetical protein
VRNASNDFTFDSVSRLWTFQLLGFEVVQVRLQKKPLQLFSIEIQKGAIFDRFKIKIIENL